eukprot:2213387-Prymnesium_polylepis.1
MARSRSAATSSPTVSSMYLTIAEYRCRLASSNVNGAAAAATLLRYASGTCSGVCTTWNAWNRKSGVETLCSAMMRSDRALKSASS